MQLIGIVQDGDAWLRRVARPFDLPAEAEEARGVIVRLNTVLDQVAVTHRFASGVGLSAPQVRIDRAALVVRTAERAAALLNPRIVEESTRSEERYEGCLSLIDVRGMVPRPVAVQVEHHDPQGTRYLACFNGTLARLIAHEIDHLHGTLYTDRMRSGLTPVPVIPYRSPPGAGRPT